MAGKEENAELEQLLSSYIDGACSQQERDRVQEALQRDPQFRALYSQLVRTIEATQAIPGEATPSHVRERILSQLERRALLGVTRVSTAAPGEPPTRQRRRTAWLGLLAAAMLVAGVGVTWWFRTQADRANYQLAMAPAADEGRTVHKATRESHPQEPNASTAAGTRDGTTPAVRDRELNHALAMDDSRHKSLAARPERPRAVDAGQAEAHEPAGTAGRSPAADLQTSAGAGNQAMARTSIPSHRPAPPPPASLQPQEAMARAAPREPASRMHPAREAAPGAVGLVASRPPPSAVAPVASSADEAVAYAQQARSAPGPASYTFGFAGGRIEGTAEAPAVTQLQVAVQARQVLPTAIVRQTEALVARSGGQIVQQPDASMVLVCLPLARYDELVEGIARMPGVAEVQSQELPAGDPLARRLAHLAAAEVWQQAARDFVAWAASAEPPLRSVWSPDLWSGTGFDRSANAPSLVPPACVPVVIVLRTAEPPAP